MQAAIGGEHRPVEDTVRLAIHGRYAGAGLLRRSWCHLSSPAERQVSLLSCYASVPDKPS